MYVKPQGPRHTDSEQDGNLAIRIPSKREILMVCFLAVWPVGWLAGEIMAPTTSVIGVHRDPGAVAFVAVWLCLWAVGGATTIYALAAWQWRFPLAPALAAAASAIALLVPITVLRTRNR